MTPRSLVPLLAFLALNVNAQLSYNGGVYSQNFDTLPGTTNNTLNQTWTDNSTLAGWYASKTTFSITDGTVGGTAAAFDSTSSTANNVGLFSFGTASSTDRALGARSTSNFAGNDPVLFGVRLVNNTTQTLTRFTVTYTGEQWFKSSVATAHTLQADYQLGASSISAGTWTSVSAGTFTAPIATGTTATALNGNSTANRAVKVFQVTGVSWLPGQELWIRFRDANESGNEQGLSVDDFNFLADDESGLFFNGSTSYVTMGTGSVSATAFGAQSFTIECRVLKTGAGVTASTGSGGVTAVPLVAKGVGEAENSNVDANYFLGIDASGRLCADFEQFSATNNGTAYAAGQNFPVTGSTVLQNGVWYHVAATYNSATAIWKLYINGVEETGLTMPITPFVGVIPRYDSVQGLGIGTTINSTGARAGFFQGVIDEVRIWNVVRSASEIVNNKDNEIISGQAGMLARFGFDEATGTAAAGTRADGAATTSGTLSGTTLPQWVNAKSFIPNIAPTVALTAPTASYSGYAPAVVSFAATASDSDGSIAKVEFYQGSTKVGEDTSAPYSFDWAGVAAGTYSLTAVATDNGGASATSSPVSITVLPNPNQPPVVALTSPASNATGIGSSTTLSVLLSDPESDPMTVTFYGRKATPTRPGPDFSLIAIPDTQFYSENTNRNGGANIALYNSQTQWVVDNRIARNIAFVSHMGDIVQNGDTYQQEWINADGAMKRIEDVSTTLRAYGIPWGGAPGNHDYGTGGGTGTTNYFNQYFGTSRWAGRNYFGGSYGTTNNNNYELFSASGLDFIVIHLEYNAGAVSSYQAVLDWADALLKAYPNRRAIVTSHWIVNTGNPASFSTQGQAIYDNLKDNPNLFLMLCGHVNGEGRRSDVFQGRTVYSILQDYQDITNGGNGFLRIYTFSPANNQINVESYSPTLGRAVQASDSVPSWTTSYTLSYNMQSAVTDWIPLGTATVIAGGTTASLGWTGLEAGSDYDWYATANDGINTAASSTRHFSTTANAAPTVALTAPVDNASVGLNAAVNITADANDIDGTITKVEFFDGGTKLGEDTSAPYTFAWNGATAGVHLLSAVATDNIGSSTLSSLVHLNVNNVPPTVALTEPDPGEVFDAPASIYMTADAADSDGSITKVEYYANGTKVGEATTAPYAFFWNNVFTGAYTLTAKAFDDAGASTVSDPLSVSVTNTDNIAPSVAITAPASGVAYAGNITITASASDIDGTISKVEFFNGATKLGEDTTAPYSFTWNSVAIGTYTLTVKATDNDGAITTSASVTINVQAAPLSFSENFDSMGISGTALPSGWSMLNANSGTTNATWTDSIPISGTGSNSVAAMVAASGALTVNNAPSATNNNGYNAQGASNSDRVVATSPTSVAGVALQWQLTNTDITIITALRIGFDTRRYTAVSTANELPGYWVFYSLDNGTTWTSVAALNPTLSGSGVQVPNTVGVTTIAPTDFTLTSGWAPGATLLLRWVDDNAVATSPDQIVGLDNVTLVAAGAQVGNAPTVALTSPTVSDTFTALATINLNATASDSDGTISKVEFYNGATKLGEATSAPFTYAWTNVATATYSLTARATDNDGNVTISSAVSVTVNPAPGSGTLTRAAYLQQAGPTTMTIRWRSSQSIAGRVKYGSSPASLTSTVDEASAQTDHEVKLTGLSPNTTYFYSIGSAFDTLAGGDAAHTFTTPPIAGSTPNTRIWVLGDAGTGTASQTSVRDAFYTWTGSRDPNLVLQLGDNAYNSGLDTEFQAKVFDIYGSLMKRVPFWSCLGNHETNQATSFVDTYPYFLIYTFPKNGECGGVPSGTEHYYSFDYGNVHFVCLDSMTASRASNGAMANWLTNDLASTTRTWIVCFFHHPPYTKGSHNSDTETELIEMRTNILPILENGGVDLVLSGHSHCYERSYLLDGHYGLSGTLTPAMKKNIGDGRPAGAGAYIKPLTGPRDHFGSVYAVTGSAGQTSGGSLNHPAHFISLNNLGSLVLDVNSNRLDATFLRETGATSDTFTIIKQGAADSDGDGVSDEFELEHGMNRFSNADATQPLDSSGLNAREQYLFGLTPGAGQRYSWETSRDQSSGNMVVSFATLPQRLYQVFWSTDLSHWFPASAQVNGNGSMMSWTDDGSSTGSASGLTDKRFYKVTVTNGP